MSLRFFNSGSQQPWAIQFILGIGLFLVAFVLRMALLPAEAGFPYLTFYPAIVLAFYLLGIWPGILVLILSTVSAFYFFMPPYSTWIMTRESAIGVASFVVFGGLIGWIVNEVSRFQSSQEEIETALGRYKAIVSTSEDAILSKDLQGVITSWNTAAEKLYGFTAEEVIGKSIFMLVPKESKEDLLLLIQRVMQGISVPHYRAYRLRKDGLQIPVMLSLSPIRDLQGNVIGISSVGHDISEQVRLEEQVKEMAFHDPLTKLANRRLLDNRISLALAVNRRSRSHSALLFIDLDNFKPLNDSHGHEAGDLLLIEVAQRLKSCVREVDTIARIGGDEFVVLLTELEAEEGIAKQHALEVAEKIRLSLEESYSLEVQQQSADKKVSHMCSASIGVTLFSGVEKSHDELLIEADAGMYEAKHAGRNRVMMYQPKE